MTHDEMIEFAENVTRGLKPDDHESTGFLGNQPVYYCFGFLYDADNENSPWFAGMLPIDSEMSAAKIVNEQLQANWFIIARRIAGAPAIESRDYFVAGEVYGGQWMTNFEKDRPTFIDFIVVGDEETFAMGIEMSEFGVHSPSQCSTLRAEKLKSCLEQQRGPTLMEYAASARAHSKASRVTRTGP